MEGVVVNMCLMFRKDRAIYNLGGREYFVNDMREVITLLSISLHTMQVTTLPSM